MRCWVTKFGPHFATELRKREARPGRVWHLDEVAVRIGGKQHRRLATRYEQRASTCLAMLTLAAILLRL